MAKTTKYTREAILASKEFEKYQKDFLRVILTKNEYTITEARKLAKEFFKED